MTIGNRLLAALVMAVTLTWIAPAHGGTSFSFSIHGGDYYRYGHGYGKHYKHYRHFRGYPYPRYYKYRGHYYGPERRYYYHYRFQWRPGYWHGPPRGYRRPPHCIHRYGRWYCR